MLNTRYYHPRSLWQFTIALTIVFLAVAGPWPVRAQDYDADLSFSGSSQSTAIPEPQVAESGEVGLSSFRPTQGSVETPLPEFNYKSGPVVLAAAAPQKQASAGGKEASDGGGDLAGAATNPLANLIQFQLQNIFIPTSYKSSGYANQFLIQPVVPINLPSKTFPTLITRTTIPIVSTPNPDGPVGGTTGSGDSVLLTAFVNNQSWGMLGVGPTFTFPTASDPRTGSEKWQVGPTAILFVTKYHPWQFGALVYSQHSFAGTSRREHVSRLFWQPVLVRHFSGGWYTGLPDLASTINLRNGENTLNFTGFRVGKVTKIGNQPVNVFVQPWYTPVAEGTAGKWNIKVNLTFMFPTD